MLFAVPGAYTFKKLVMNAGAKGGLQYHHKKDEGGYLVSGQLKVRFDAGDGNISERVVNAGECMHFPIGSVHQEEALTDCVIIEVSTPFLNDRVRVEEQYGLPKGEGLPSTTADEVTAVQ